MSNPRRSAETSSTGLRLAAGLHFLLGAGFGLSVPFVLAHLNRHGELPMSPFGFRYLSGPFEQLGTDRLVVLGWALVAVSAVDVLVGVWLWQGRRGALRLANATDASALILGIGFSLPLLIIGVPVRAFLLIMNRRALAEQG